jgi:hypothetical protein
MFNAFKGAPRIVRLFGIGNLHLYITFFNTKRRSVGTVHEFGSPGYNALIPPEDRHLGSRSAIVLDIHKVGSVSNLFLFLLHRKHAHVYC